MLCVRRSARLVATSTGAAVARSAVAAAGGGGQSGGGGRRRAARAGLGFGSQMNLRAQIGAAVIERVAVTVARLVGSKSAGSKSVGSKSEVSR